MRATVALDDALVEKAQEYSGVTERTALLREALKALIHMKPRAGWPRSGELSPISKTSSVRESRSGRGLALILADTSVWVDHLRRNHPQMANLLLAGQIVMHPFIVAEIALGSLRNRPKILAEMDALRSVQWPGSTKCGI